MLQLLTGTTEEVAHLIGTYDWYFVPVMNPDGYTYSHTHVMILSILYIYTYNVYRMQLW